jgi:hypothetical protein
MLLLASNTNKTRVKEDWLWIDCPNTMVVKIILTANNFIFNIILKVKYLNKKIEKKK